MSFPEREAASKVDFFRFKRRGGSRDEPLSSLYMNSYSRRDKPSELSNHQESTADHSDRSHRRHGRRRHHHNRHHHFKSSGTKLDTRTNGTNPGLDAEQAFRESLFDALADDEGADYWSHVYGQPIHTHDTDLLHTMAEEEYVAYVRRKMWERSPQYIELERQRIVRERKQRVGEEERRRAADDDTERRRGRRKAKRRAEGSDFASPGWETSSNLNHTRSTKDWQKSWSRYLDGWKKLPTRHTNSRTEPPIDMDQTRQAKNSKEILLCTILPYPVLSNQYVDVTAAAVRSFLCNYHNDEAGPNQLDLLSILKAERVRWHPDKVEQMYGGRDGELGIDTCSLRVVTDVFQIIEAFFSEVKTTKESPL
ncbi:hypothetical protein MMC25_004272 [Agyrium rufum]|nr:hypothetical protein [Agyrium rufum]